MPGYDRTGPAGQGPMTGRGMGSCNPNVQANNPGPLGMGFGRGCGGRGRGFRNRFFNAPVPVSNKDDKIAELQSQIACLQEELSSLRQQDENSDNQR